MLTKGICKMPTYLIATLIKLAAVFLTTIICSGPLTAKYEQVFIYRQPRHTSSLNGVTDPQEFFEIFDNEIVDLSVTDTNRYARQFSEERLANLMARLRSEG